MAKNYYVNRSVSSNPNFNHEVHTEDCPYLPSTLNRDFLGCFSSSSEAIKEAKKKYSNVDGCAICCADSHDE